MKKSLYGVPGLANNAAAKNTATQPLANVAFTGGKNSRAVISPTSEAVVA